MIKMVPMRDVMENQRLTTLAVIMGPGLGITVSDRIRALKSMGQRSCQSSAPATKSQHQEDPYARDLREREKSAREWIEVLDRSYQEYCTGIEERERYYREREP